jgi:alpha-tubulin suppressor-like RCC1 family protein
VLFAVAAAAALAGCLPAADYRCTRNDQCGAEGLCEGDGRCSAFDPRCPTGRRYLAHEGDASNACVSETCAKNPLVAVSAGNEHACARRGDGTVSCWGRNDDGQLGDGTHTPRSSDVVVATLPAAVSVAAGQRHTCAAVGSGEVYCWGADDAGQLGDGGGHPSATPAPVSGISNAVGVAAGEAFSCAVLADGTARCWGDDTSGQLGDGGDAKTGRLPAAVFALTGVRSIAAGWQHACALRDDETLWCWGANDAGQVGDGTRGVPRPRPVQVQTMGAVTRVAAGLQHTCAATRAAGLFCWGDNGAGQLGTGDAGPALSPVPVRLVSNPIAVAAGASHTCAVRQGGATLCWGANVDGQLGEGSTSALPIPAPVLSLPASADVVAGGSYACALDGHGAVFCWGDDHFGQLGLGRVVTRGKPAPVVGLTGATEIASGGDHTCAVVVTGDAPASVVCWGANEAGQLGDATTVDRARPAPVKGAIEAAHVAAGLQHSCALGGGALACWGRGGSGQLGPARMVDSSTPVEVPLDGTPSAVAAGDAHTCAVLTDGRAECWGADGDGQLGDGATAGRGKPAFVLDGGGATSALVGIDGLAAGAGHTCAHLGDDTLRCWGRGADGQLGDGTQAMSLLPVAVTLGPRPGTPAVSVVAGAAHSCAVDMNGEGWCWGRGGDGRLGTGDTSDALAPSSIVAPPSPPHPSSGAGTTLLAAGGAHTCAIESDGSVSCWGANDDGQLGRDGDSSATPELVTGLAGVALAAGTSHTCALLLDGTVWCWGANTAGQLGDDDALTQLKPQLSRLACP